MSNTANTMKRATGLLVIEVINSNPNGNPDRESDPRQRPDRRGEISPVSFKRKPRDLVEDKSGPVWKELKGQLQLNDDEFDILESRGRDRTVIMNELKGDGAAFKKRYWDGRVFGNTFLESLKDEKIDKALASLTDADKKCIKTNAIKTGVVQFGLGISVAPVDIERLTFTNKAGVEGDKDRGMAPMGYRIVKHGVYCMPFFVNPSMAHKTGCNARDIELLKRLIPYAYAHTRSLVRPFVEIRHAWYCEHANALGSSSDFAIIDALKPTKNGDPNSFSTDAGDYTWPRGLSDELEKKGVTCVDLMNAI